MRLIKAKDNSDTALCHHNYLHSRYSPLKEAEKYLKNWTTENQLSDSSILVLFEPGLGYLLSIIKKSFPRIKKIIVIFYSEETFSYCRSKNLLTAVECWNPGADVSLTHFLSHQFPEFIPDNLVLMDWAPGRSCFSHSSQAIKSGFLNYLKILQGNTITTMKFARKWFYNSVRNYLEQDFSLSLSSVQKNILIVASGFSLNSRIDEIKKKSGYFFIVALPSSVLCLLKEGIIPDLIITTDPGYYASLHYRSFPEESLIAAPFTFCPPSFRRKMIGIDQNTWLDKTFNPTGTLFSLKSPEMGTVAATAIKIMHEISPSGIYITGLDLCYRGIEEHAAPHEFDILSLLGADRLNPELNKRFKRVHDQAIKYEDGYYYTRSLDTYGSWFNKGNSSDRIFRLTGSPVKLPFPEIDELPIQKGNAASLSVPAQKNRSYPDYKERKEIFLNMHKSWKQDLLLLKRTGLIDPDSSLGKILNNIYPGRSRVSAGLDKILDETETLLLKAANL